MLDHCGMTLAKVNLNKPSLEGQNLVSLQMNRTNLNSAQLKSMLDPVVICRDDNRDNAEEGVMYVGNLCLTHDMIQYHKTFPNKKPQAGDVIAFLNTAAYQMDFAESYVLQQKIAEKIAVCEVEPNVFKWVKDELYNPMTIKKGYIA